MPPKRGSGSKKRGRGVGPLGEATVAYLEDVKVGIAKMPATIWSATKAPPLEIPHYDELVAAAEQLDTDPETAYSRNQIITKLLGRANTWDQLPNAEGQNTNVVLLSALQIAGPNGIPDTQFPAIHHLHPTWANEWYWMGCRIPVVDKNDASRTGYVSILQTIQKFRAIGNKTQGRLAWSDKDSVILFNTSTATVKIDGEDTPAYVRRTPEGYWGKQAPDSIDYSVAGDKSFRIRCGGDSIVSENLNLTMDAPEILPLNFTISDGTNINFKVRCTARSGVDPNKGWFLQGIPTGVGKPGMGFTLAPSPGFYYSWPQVVVTPDAGSPDLVIDGKTYTATGAGSGWIDHQMMCACPQNTASDTSPTGLTSAPTRPPLVYKQDTHPVEGWTWQFCNYDDGKTAWTGASFINGVNSALSGISLNPYGFKLNLGSDGRWKAGYTVGIGMAFPTLPVSAPASDEAQKLVSDFFAKNPTQAQVTQPDMTNVSTVSVPADRIFMDLGESLATLESDAKELRLWDLLKDVKNLALMLKGESWKNVPGNLNNVDTSMAVEIPGDFSELLTGKHVGWGYIESVGYEPNFNQTERQLAYLRTNQLPLPWPQKK